MLSVSFVCKRLNHGVTEGTKGNESMVPGQRQMQEGTITVPGLGTHEYNRIYRICSHSFETDLRRNITDRALSVHSQSTRR